MAAAKVGGGQLAGDDFAVTARWGIAGKGGITMPSTGDGRLREFSAPERLALAAIPKGSGVDCGSDRPSGKTKPQSTPDPLASPPAAGPPSLTALDLLGPATLDIHLNPAAYWRNVPQNVWDYTLGGYQVLKKWLSYRERALLGRPLTSDEVAYFQGTIRRIAALLLLGPELDANYANVKGNTFAWPRAQPPEQGHATTGE